MEALTAMPVRNQILISFFDSKQEADEGRALVAEPANGGLRRTPAAVVSRGPDNSRSPVEPPAAVPFGAVLGTALGGVLGLVAGEAGVVVGLFFGLYVGLFADVWRTLARGDVLDEVQDGLAPGQAALVIFVGLAPSAAIERRLASTRAVTVHRFPRRPIEDDFAREARSAASELDQLLNPDRPIDGAPGDRDRAIAATRRKLAMLEAIGARLLWLERLQFGFETGILNRELEESPRWRAPRVRRRVGQIRVVHRRAQATLESSNARVLAAEVEATRAHIGGRSGIATRRGLRQSAPTDGILRACGGGNDEWQVAAARRPRYGSGRSASLRVLYRRMP